MSDPTVPGTGPHVDGAHGLGESDVACQVTRLDPASASPAPGVGESSRVLADHTTFRLGGPADRLVVARTQRELIDAVLQADQSGSPLLVLSGGSNLLVADEGFPGTVVKVATRGIEAEVSGCGGAVVTVQAGEVWDDFVAHAVAQEWIGIEALSGIPGAVGSTPVQNVGAYGSDIAQSVYRVRTLDRVSGQYRTFTASECAFGYRDSVFKQTRMPDGGPTGRYVVLEVTFQFTLGTRSAPVRYRELAERLGIAVGERSTTSAVREAVLGLRRGKGMVSDPADHDTWSAGSFFTNPVLDEQAAGALPPGAPRFPAPGGRTKTSAAWLIEHAGFGKGFSLEGPRVVASLSTKHTLALTNRGGATTADVVALARAVRDGVQRTFGVTLEPEPVLVEVAL